MKEDADALRAKAAEAARVGTGSSLAVAVSLERRANQIDKLEHRPVDEAKLNEYVAAYERAGGKGMKDMSGDATLDMDLKKTKARIAKQPTPVAPREHRHHAHHHAEMAGLALLGAGGLFGLGWLMHRKSRGR